MKALNQIGMALCLLVGLASCEMREEILGKKESQGSGLLSLSVEAIAPKVQTKSAVVTDNFAVSIVGVSDEVKDYTKDFDRVSDLPASIELPVGTYNVVSHTPGDLKKRMDHPYYLGDKDLLIEKNKDTQANVQCKMRNSRIQLNYSVEFLAAFQSWTITLDDGSGIAYKVEHDNTIGTTPKVGYYAFEENGAEYVTLNIRATTVTGNTITFSQPYYKADAETGYEEEDDPNFKGGDALIITLDPKAPDAPTSGTIGIDVTVNVLFANSDTEVKIEVNDKNQTPDPKPDPDPTPGEQEPSMVLPAGGTYSATEIPVDLNAILKTPAGLESAIVRIETDNANFEKTLQDVAFDKPGALLTGADLVGNNAMQTLFNGLGGDNPKQTPQKGETEYEFPISAFSTFLGMFVGTHTFHIELTDVNGKGATGSLTLTITE
jgi:hypothetical protein